MWSRRQFGQWATAALLLGPGVASAGGKAEPQQVQADQKAEAEAPSDLDAVELTVTLVEVRERADDGMTPDIELSLHAKNTGKAGQSVTFALARAVITEGKAESSAHAWLNDDHPFSRRIHMPAFVDLAPAKDPSLVAAVKVLSDDGVAEGATLQLEVTVNDAQGNSRLVKLPPIALSGDEAKS